MIDPFDIEDAFYKDENRESKDKRKRKEATDRSKYKKSDQKKHAKEHLLPDLEEGAKTGIVVEISSRGYFVETDSGILLCNIRGSLKEEWHDDKTLVAIGDKVQWTPKNDNEGVISAVYPRTSELVRQDNLTRRKKQIIASNIDLVVITVSIGVPPLKASIIDRYLIAARDGNLKAIIVVNKIDLLESYPEQKELLKEVEKAYAQANVPLFLVSSETGIGIPALEEELKGKISVFSGPSGVGKSSLLYHLTGIELMIGDVVFKTQKGAHTTTSPKLIPLNKGGHTIDTPGIRSFGLFKIDKDGIKKGFPEWEALAQKCRFSNCTHRSEEGCAVKKAVEKGKISPLRYDSYLDLLEDLDQTHKRR